MPRTWDNISDWEFELVAGDLLGADLGVRFERFPRGPDREIDRRHLRDDGRPDVIQAKHYKGSSYSQLKRAVRKEAERLPALDPQPASYRLVTSQPLTARRKSELAGLLHPYVKREDHVRCSTAGPAAAITGGAGPASNHRHHARASVASFRG